MSARLVIERGMSHVTLRTDSSAAELLSARFDGKKGPKIDADGSTFHVRFERGWPWQRSSAELVLSTAAAWDIEVKGGLAHTRGELEALTLASLTIAGGMSDVELSLGRPNGTCPVRLLGGASHWVVRRPKGVGAHLSIRGGASHVALDDAFFGAVGGKLRMDSYDYVASKDRYDFDIVGGVSHLKIG